MNLKEKVSLGLGVMTGGVAIVIYLLLGGLALLIHILTMFIAWSVSGIFAAVISLSLPVFAQIYWIIYLWRETGIFLNNYTLLNLAYVGILALVFGVIVVIALVSDRRG